MLHRVAAMAAIAVQPGAHPPPAAAVASTQAAHATWAAEREAAFQALFPNRLSRLEVGTDQNRLDALVRFFHARMRAGVRS